MKTNSPHPKIRIRFRTARNSE